MERKKRSKGSVWEFCCANKIFGTFGDEIKAYGQKLVKLCTHTHTHAAKLVVEMCLHSPDAGATSAMKHVAARVTATESAHPDSVKQHVDCATRNNKPLDHCYTVHKNV